MHWSLLVVASSMGNEQNLRLLPSARTQITQLPDCDVFLAPSTIPGSASMRTQTNKTMNFRVPCVLELFEFCNLIYLTVPVTLACSCARIHAFERCAYCMQLLHLFLINFTGTRLDYKQLVSEFLQDALSKRMS